ALAHGLVEACQAEHAAEPHEALKSVALLVPWMVWKHRNSCVFDSATPSMNTLLDRIKDEACSWVAAGAPGLRLVLPQTWDVH
uniref:Uncharacterized protein n=1 Tax=Aegilops tauschii subsp. strangulata TaxID=200361 RepID=A0A453IF66_AEGTS